MEATDSILSKIAEYTVAPVGRQVGYVIYCNRNLPRLHLQVLRLKALRERFAQEVDAAEITGERDLRKAGEITVMAEELLSDENQANLKCLHGFCPNLKYRYQLGRRSARLMEQIDELFWSRGRSVSGSDQIVPREWGVSTGEYLALPSRTSTVKEIMYELKNSDAHRIVVWGPTGAGKTLLAKEVYRQAREDKKLFDNVVILLDVKKNPDLEVIQNKIVRQLDMKILDDENLDGRASRLRARILDKKILVFLDAVWEQIDLDALGLPNVPTCKILLTSKTPFSGTKTRNFELSHLDDEEACFLFGKRIGDDVKEAVYIRNVATRVNYRFGGLPILIVIVASTLKRISTLTSWENALRCLARGPQEGIEWSYNQLNDEEVKQLFLLCGFAIWGKDIYLPALLKFSMGLGLFSKAYTMEQAKDAFQSSVQKLKEFYLLTDSDDDNRYVRMHDLVREVADRIAFRDGHILSSVGNMYDYEYFKKCSMISSQYSTVPVLSEVTRINPKLKMLYLHGKGDNSVVMPSNFFREIQELKMLDLSRLHLLSLPSSLQFLKNMHALFLNQCTLGDVSLVGQLSNLEILSFSQSSVKQLPKEIGHLTRLRVLDLSDCSELEVISPNVISSLERLEDLRMRNSFNKWEVEGKRSNASLSELKYLSQLSVLQIHILNADILPANLFSRKLERFNVFIGDEWVERYTRKTLLMVETPLNTLKLKPTTSTEGLDTGLKLLLKITEDLSLDGTEGVNDILDQLDTQDSKHLKHLEVQNNVDIRYLINREVLLRNLTSFTVHRCDGSSFLLSPSMARSFVQLNHLVISECQIMEEIVSTKEYSEENKDNMFPKLEKLELSDLPHLTRFCSGSYVEFASLKTVQLEKCTKLETFISNRETVAPYFLFDEKVGFPRLERLTINDLPKLTTIWHTQLAQSSFCKLRDITVQRCNSLKSILPDSIIAGAFQELQKLTVEDCVVEEIVAKEEGLEIQNHDKFFPKLVCLELKSLSQLKRFYPSMPAFSWPNLKTLVLFDCQQVDIFTPEFSGQEKTHDSGSQSIPVKQSSVLINKVLLRNLISFTVHRCDGSSFLLSPSMARSFVQLKHLVISECQIMEEIVSTKEYSEENKDNMFPKLEKLELSDLPHLTRFCSGGYVEFASLERLQLEKCTKLETFISTHESAAPYFLFDEKVGFPRLEILTVNDLPKLTTMWHTQLARNSFCKLRDVTVQRCNSLKSIFPDSIIAGAFQELQNLTVEDCVVEEIVAKEEGLEKQNHNKFFPKLECLELKSLSQLKRFYPSMPAAFSLPNLKTLVLFDCQQVDIFTPEFSGHEKTRDLGSRSIPVKQSSVIIDKTSFPNLEDLTLVCMDNWHSRPAPSVLCAKAVFSGISSRHPDGGSLLPLRTLRLHGMKKPMYLWDTTESAGPDFPELEILEVKFCGLKNLELPAISFQNLTILEVTFCWRLQYLATYTVAQGLVRLKKLKVDECKNMKEIFTTEGMEEDASECEIVFSRLQHLELTDLISLERFCQRNCRVKVPATLGTLEVKWCSFELKISSDGVLEEIVPNMHLDVQKSHPKEEALITNQKQPSPNASEGARHVEFNPRELHDDSLKTEPNKDGPPRPGIAESEHGGVEAVVQETPINWHNMNHAEAMDLKHKHIVTNTWEADFGREESLTEPLNADVGNQLQLKQLDGVQTESWLQSIAIKLDEDIGGLRNELRRLQKELSAKEAERRDTEQKLADLVRAKRLSDPSGS